MKMTFLKICEKILLEAVIALTPTEIWKRSKTRFNKKTKSSRPESTVSSRLFTSVKSDPLSPFIRIEEGGQVKYGLKIWEDNIKNKTSIRVLQPELKDPVKLHERAFHPLLTYHQHYYNNQVYTLTIRHERSLKSNKINNEWAHPDMVGVRFNFIDWNHRLKDLSMLVGGYNHVKFLSYELKKELSPSNFREHFFQTVSNSSWANEGFLVAVDIDPDEEFRQELKRLSVEHGIGIIELSQEADNSQILFPARYKEEIQYEKVNKLCKINPDFCTFVETVYKCLNINEILTSHFDTILEADELRQQIKGELNIFETIASNPEKNISG